MRPEFKVYVHTLAQYTAFGSGEYAMYALKKKSGTDSFKQLPDQQKKCHNHNREQCETNMFFEQIEKNCNCVPWALVADDNSELVRWQVHIVQLMLLNNVFRSFHQKQHFQKVLIWTQKCHEFAGDKLLWARERRVCFKPNLEVQGVLSFLYWPLR